MRMWQDLISKAAAERHENHFWACVKTGADISNVLRDGEWTQLVTVHFCERDFHIFNWMFSKLYFLKQQKHFSKTFTDSYKLFPANQRDSQPINQSINQSIKVHYKNTAAQVLDWIDDLKITHINQSLKFIQQLYFSNNLSLWLIGTVRAEPETVISRAWVQSPDPAE